MKVNSILIVLIVALVYVSCNSSQQPNSGIANVKDYGAVGDGKSDDTKAIQKAVADLPDSGGVVYFPPGHYLTNTIQGKDYVCFKGDACFSWLPNANGSPVISPVSDSLKYLFNLKDCVGTQMHGLIIDGQNKGDHITGIFTSRSGQKKSVPFQGTTRTLTGEEQNIVIDNCKISNFSGSGIELNVGWVWAIRHSLISNNRCDGLKIRGWDGYIIDCIIALNGGLGINGSHFTASTITGTRIELNEKGGLYVGHGSGLQVSNGFFCENGGPAIWLQGKKVEAITITGNLFRRNGKHRDHEPNLNCNILLSQCKGVALTGNSFYHSTLPWDNPKPYQWPKYAIVLDSLKDCVIANNAGYNGAWDKLIFDHENHNNIVVRDNPGSLKNIGSSRNR